MREFKESRVYEFETFRLDADNLLLFHAGVQLPLTPKVVATLLALVERQGEIVSKDDLMEIVWPDTQVEEGNLTQNLYLLRKTLGTSAKGLPFFETLRRRGYRFSVRATLVSGKADKTEVSSPPVIVERMENIYSVVDWQRDRRDADTGKLVKPSTAAIAGERTRVSPFGRSVPTIAVLLILVIGLIAFVSFKTPTGVASLKVANELTIRQLTDGRDVDDATISPDGDYFTYHETDGDISRIFVQQVGQSARVEVVSATRRTIFSKTFSPDGQYIYFLASDKDVPVTSLYRVPTLGGIQTKLLDDLGSTVAVSPDGRELAFARSSSDAKYTEIIVADKDGLNPHSVLKGNESSFIWGGLSWSPDGNSIAFGEVDMKSTGEGRCTISSVNPETGKVRVLSPDKWDTCGRMEWSHDNKGLLFIGTRSGEAVTNRRDQLFYLSLETGEAKRLTNNGDRLLVSSLGVTRTGAVLVVPFSRSSQLWIMDPGGTADSAKQITNGQADGRAGIAALPDGRIGYLGRAGDSLSIWMVNGDGSDIRQVTAEPGQLEELNVSRDGQYFYFSSYANGKPRLLRCKVDNCDAAPAIDDSTFDIDSSVSPDGNWIVYNSSVFNENGLQRTLRLVPANGGGHIQLTDQYSVAPHYSPDGGYISFIGRDDMIKVVTAPDGKAVRTFRPQQLPLLNMGARWTPDGKALAYVAKDRSAGNIWLQPLDGSAPRQLTNFSSGEIYNFAYTADGQKIVLARGNPTRDAILMKIER